MKGYLLYHKLSSIYEELVRRLLHLEQLFNTKRFKTTLLSFAEVRDVSIEFFCFDVFSCQNSNAISVLVKFDSLFSLLFNVRKVIIIAR